MAAAPTQAEKAMTEITIRGLILGVAMTFVFTAANVYLGLQVGLTFATSIPAAVISMAVLRMFASRSILENNIVQIVASAAGALASIIFVVPGLVMIGWWTGFDYWQTFAICAFGGVLGVMFSIPLRRALVANSPLPYPEGVAAAEVLKVGTSQEADAENKRGLLVILIGTLASAGLAALAAMRVAAGEFARFFQIGASATGATFGFQLALIGAGHLVGLSVGLAMLLGLFIAWGVATPLLTSLATPEAGQAVEAFAISVWRSEVRFIGAGAIGVAAIWALIKLIRPVFGGLFSSFSAGAGAATRERTDRDMPGPYILAITVICLIPLAQMLYAFATADPALRPLTWELTAIGVGFVIVGGFIVACVCGYMAGLIGSSNSPISGVGILAITTFSYLLAVFVLPRLGNVDPLPLIAFALIVVGIAFAAAAISNDNLQDLKTGHLVGGTPWRQQTALIIGVIAGAVVIPPILDLLNQAYGFALLDGGRSGGAAGEPLPAPQATLISTLSMGVIGGDLNWTMIGIGVILGIALVIVDEAFGLFKLIRLPPLAVGIGIYLPMATVAAVVLGAVLGRLYENAMKRTANPEAGKRLGVLLASGLIVGESLFNVALAGLIVATSSGTPLAVLGDGFAAASVWVGLAVFAALVAALYAWISGMARRAA